MKAEKESLDNEISKIREGAIDAIMEKERIIMELREKIFEADDDSGSETLHLKMSALN